MSKPTIAFVPGAFHSPDTYKSVIHILEAHSYECVGVHLPSVGPSTACEDFSEDVAAIRASVEKLVEEEKEVVIVLHSYSGLPGSEALEGLGKKNRQADGKKGGVIRIVFIMAYLVPEGFQQVAKGDNTKFPEWVKVDEKTGLATVTREDAKRIFYNDFSDTEGDHWADQLRPQSVGVFSSTATYAAWRHIPSTFIQAEKDQSTFTPELVEMSIKGAQQIEPTAIDVWEKCNAGHFPMISQPEWTAGAIMKAAGEQG